MPACILSASLSNPGSAVAELFFQDANSLSAPRGLMAVEGAQQLAGSGPLVLGKEWLKSDIHNRSDMAVLRGTCP